MGHGILPDRHLGENVPGTSLLDDLYGHGTRHVDTSAAQLKRGKDGIILIPQPSDSPNDPLNWPFWRKTMLMVTITFGAGVVGAFGPIIGAGLVDVAENLDTTVGKLSMITGDLVLSIGLILFLTAPASVIWGRRPVFLLGNALLLASAIWSAVAKDLGSFTASRVIGGFGMAPIECLVEATVADIFFVHERGTWIAVWSFALLGGICGVSIVNGYLIQDASWRLCFVIEAALVRLCGVLLIMTILFVPETAYVRQDVLTISGLGTKPELGEKPELDAKPELSSASRDLSRSKSSSIEEVVVESKAADIESSKEVPQSFLQLMKPWAGHRFSDQSFLKVGARPLTLAASPVVAWGILVFGTTNAWLVALSVCVSLLFSDPQFGYNFKAGPVGLIAGVGPFIAAFLGNLMAGPLSDWTVRYMSRRNGGVYEPEFRLLMIIPLFISTTMGWFGWAISANLKELWIGPAVFYSLINFGQAVGAIGVVTYVVDAHANYAPEAFASINGLKNIFTFGVTYFVTSWIQEQGVLRTFSTIGGINVFVCLMTIPMYIYGKRARSWVHRTPWMLA
ncbi:MFS general substrate transporter [Phellopilus nigrolimitatus]|nr:MFS general substrate transporter [Phellopilus nigrolimitatus]